MDLPEQTEVVTAAMIQGIIADIELEQAAQQDRYVIADGNRNGLRPGDDFNRRASWPEILEPVGWKIARQCDKQTQWTRPGKDDGVSATTGYCKNDKSGDLLHVFSKNAPPFRDGESYSRFSAFAMLHHSGDFSAAARALNAAGYGLRNGETRQLTEAITTKQTSNDKPLPTILARPASWYAVASIDWLWPGRIPRGTLTILDGDPGLGKSTITLDLAARVSRGYAMPPCLAEHERDPAHVVILSAEDDPARTIRPRLEAAGADLECVHLVEGIVVGGGDRLPILPFDLPTLGEFIVEKQAALVIVDPLMAFLGDGIESHKDQSIRLALREFSKLAERTQCAFFVVRHLNKLAGGAAIYRGGGSIGIIGAARSGLLLAKHPEDPNSRVLASVKSNLGPRPKSIVVSLKAAGDVAVAVWGAEIDMSADELLEQSASARPKLDRCIATIDEIMGNGPMKSTDLDGRLKAAGFSTATIRRAKKEVGVRSFKSSMDGEWWVELSGVNEGAHVDLDACTQGEMSAFAKTQCSDEGAHQPP